mmetsp:Transcript_110624/g.253340  ORF Transcript_110624/g.253340 Transcript_110624/m.253340 type:complete len:571 (-) Transcript_110624:515-2227(-)
MRLHVAVGGCLAATHHGVAAEPQSPLQRIVALLKDMQTQISTETAEDESTYNKLSCWCDNNEKEKTSSVEEAQSAIEMLTSDIASGEKSAQELKSQISQAKEELASNQEALDSATSMREREQKEFHAYETEAIANIEALKAAVLVLGKAQSLVQDSDDGVAFLQSRVDRRMRYDDEDGDGRRMVSKSAAPHVDLAQTKVTMTRALFASVKNVVNSHLDLETAGKVNEVMMELTDGEVGAQSGEIYGVMQQLLEDMQKTLKETSERDSASALSFQGLESEKKDEIKKNTDFIDSRMGALAATEKKLMDDKQDLEDTQRDLEADSTFLENLKTNCKKQDDEYTERSRTRADEAKAVSEAISILTEQEQQPEQEGTETFVQVHTRISTRARISAAEILRSSASRTGSVDLSFLASSVRLDSFTKVKEAMNKMIDTLKRQQSDEVKQKTFCEKEFHSNEMQTAEKENEKDEIAARVATLESDMDVTAKRIEELEAEISDARVEIQKAGQDRLSENKEFQKHVAEDNATIKMLAKAMNRLQAFYSQHAFLQQPSSVSEASSVRYLAAAALRRVIV